MLALPPRADERHGPRDRGDQGIVAVFFAALLLIGVVASGTRQLTPEEIRMLVETPMPE